MLPQLGFRLLLLLVASGLLGCLAHPCGKYTPFKAKTAWNDLFGKPKKPPKRKKPIIGSIAGLQLKEDDHDSYWTVDYPDISKRGWGHTNEEIPDRGGIFTSALSEHDPYVVLPWRELWDMMLGRKPFKEGKEKPTKKEENTKKQEPVYQQPVDPKTQGSGVVTTLGDSSGWRSDDPDITKRIWGHVNKRTMPGRDNYHFEFNVNRNITQAHEEAIKDAIDKAGKLTSRSRPKARWIHPGFDWIDIIDTPKGGCVVYANTTIDERTVITTRAEMAAKYENATEGGAPRSVKATEGKEEKEWFEQTFDKVRVVPTPMGALFVRDNVTYGYRIVIHDSAMRLAIAYGKRPHKSQFNSGDYYGELLMKAHRFGRYDEFGL